MKAFLKNDAGATMVEAALAMMILMVMVGAIIDFGFALYEYNFLNYTTTRAAREITAKISVSHQCDDIETYLTEVAHREMTSAIRAAAATSWSWSMGIRSKAPGGKNLYNFQLVGKLPLNCFFMCNFTPKDWAITSTVTASIDSPDIYCDAGGPVP